MNLSLILLLISTIASGAGISIVAPNFPELTLQLGVSESMLGCLMSFFPFFQMSSLIFTQYFYKYLSPKTVLIISTVFESISGFLYSLLDKMPNKFCVIIFGLLFRALHGFACGVTNMTINKLLIEISEPNDIPRNIGLFQSFIFIGTSLGPLVSSICQTGSGYSLTYYIISGVYLLISISLIFLNPPVQKDQKEQEKVEKDNFIENIKMKEQTKFYYNYKNINVVFHSLPLFFFLLCNTFYYPSLTLYLLKAYSMKTEVSSLFFMISSGVYVIGSLLINFIYKIIGLQTLTTIGLIILAIGTFFIYPVDFLPDSIIFTVFGLFFVGISSIGTMLSSTLLIQIYLKKKKKFLDSITLNCITASIYNMNLPVAEMIGPFLGGFISQYIGENYLSTALAIIVIIYSIVYFIYYRHEIIKECGHRANHNEDSNDQNIMEEFDKEPDYGTLEDDEYKNVNEVRTNTLMFEEEEEEK